MRRWTEALVIASAVVESLLREAVFSNASSEKLAKALWSAYRSRGEDLFKEILPALGFAHLPTDAPAVWAEYQSARRNRGAFAHGQRTDAFERTTETQTKADLAALAQTARWVSLQIGRPWALDVPDPERDGLLMREFP